MMIARGSVFVSFFYLLGSAAGTEVQQGSQRVRDLSDPAAGGICMFYGAFTSSIPNASDYCECSEFITCTMDSNCQDAGELREEADAAGLQSMALANAPNITGTQCIEKMSANITLNEPQTHIIVNACGTYQTQELSEICALFEMVPSLSNPTISQCLNVSYGGLPCSCEVCNQGMGLNFSCAEYHPNVTSNGCQEYSTDDFNTLTTMLEGDASTTVTADFPEPESVSESASADAGSDEVVAADASPSSATSTMQQLVVFLWTSAAFGVMFFL